MKHFGYRIHHTRALPLDLARANPGPPFSLTFDGQEIQALPGQTVAAALWSAGITAWRTTRGSGSPRGVFCGIGVCFDCLVTVDGRPNQRACLVPAEPGADVRTQRGTGHDG
ncbi:MULTISPECIES: (2Fe-2S)-binding protein [unclassified Streptomyces]|uniref:(2Fe-2S)-binding protein n=1 Tax=unclassified Streptomyces TaxID=2593676 RepID=UPI00093FCB0C|nr:(2Fe-2S)-binding protein [Streptomyces sp. TSRI0107]